jgi:hypothetical protein
LGKHYHRCNKYCSCSLSLTVTGKLPALYYIFFAVIEIATTSLIVWYAWKWHEEPVTNVN